MSVGTVLGGRYELLASLGTGGFGTVWRAHDRTLGRDVAVKLIALDVARPEARAEVAARFEREARALGALNHPNIVTAHDYGVEGDAAYLVMELIDGGSLQDELAARSAGGPGGLAVDRVISLAIQICAGLSAAHAAGVIHRDLKPANVMIASGDQVKIVDFGIARIVDTSRITHTGAYVGTLRYTSPEQMTAEPVDARSDLYSLGCLLFELVTGRSPYQAASPVQWMAAHQYGTPAKLRTYAPTAPVALEVLIDQMLAKKPADRPASARDVRERLERIRSAAATPATAPPMQRPTSPPPTGPPPTGPPPRPATSPVPAPTYQAATYPAPPYSSGFPGAAIPRAPAPYRPPGFAGPVGPWPGPIPPPGSIQRPGPPWPVRTAAWMLRLTAALTAWVVLGALVAYHRIAVNWDRAYGSITQGSAMPMLGIVMIVLGGAVQIIAATVLAAQVRRGNRVGVVVAWVFILANVLCCFGTFASSAAFAPTSGDYSTSNQALITAANERFGSTYPEWLTAISTTVGVVGILALIVAATMMLRRPSRLYFRSMRALRAHR
jgi:serine/threonine protein kinase